MARLLEKRPLFHTRDLDRARAEVAKVHCDHTLELSRGISVNAYYNHAPLSQISLNFIEYGAEVLITSGELRDFFLIQLPLGGSAFIQSGKYEGLTKPGLASILAPDQDIRMHWSAYCQQILVKIDRSALEQQLITLIGSSLDEPIHFDLLMPSNDGELASWWRMIRFLIDEFEEGESLVTSGPSVASLEQTIMTNLLYAQPHSYSRQLYETEAPIAPVHVKRAEEYMREYISSPITVNDLIAVTGVSARTLHNGFRHFRQSTPMNYLRKIRLENARKDLMAPAECTRVTDIAAKWGFTQMGRFASIYKQTYGELPSKTLHRYKLCYHH